MKRETKKKNRGFSLIELVIVVAIMAILVGILAPQYIKYVEKSRKSADATNVDSIVTSFKIAAADDANKLPAGDYKFTFAETGITVNYKPTDGTDAVLDLTKDTGKKLDDVMVEAMGDNWEKAKLKSKQWGDAGVSATITYATDGSCTVTYVPDSLKEEGK